MDFFDFLTDQRLSRLIPARNAGFSETAHGPGLEARFLPPKAGNGTAKCMFLANSDCARLEL